VNELNDIIRKLDKDVLVQIANLVKTPKSEYAKEYEVAIERVSESKLERIGNLAENQVFLIEKTEGQE
jgi:hypothetical protein